MNRARGHGHVPVEAPPRPEVLVTLARRIAEVYRNADDDLRHAVHDSLLAGTPKCALADDLEDSAVDLEPEPGVAVAVPPAGSS